VSYTFTDGSTYGITEYPLPGSATGRQPRSLALGADGNVWFVEKQGSKIGRITPAGSITEWATLTANAVPMSICPGPDGNVWFSEDVGNLGRILPNGTITEFPVLTPSGVPRGVRPGPNGDLWFVESSTGNLGRMAPSGVAQEFPANLSQPGSIVAGPDGNMWVTAGNSIYVANLSGTVLAVYPIPTPNSSPSVISAGPDGNLWFVERTGNKIGRITTSGTIAEFALPTTSGAPYWIALGPDGNFWLTEYTAGKIAKITPTGVITEVASLAVGRQPYGIVMGGDGNLWFAEYGADKIGMLQMPLINGACGAWNGQGTPPPSAQLCQLGMASGVTGSGTWTCVGVNGGTSAACPTNTLPGSHVTINGSNGNSVSFGLITSSGSTSVTPDPSCTNLPAGLLTGAACTSVTTTANYDTSAGLQVCLALPQGIVSGVTVVQCDLVASGTSCPPEGGDPRLTTLITGALGQSMCCGQLPIDNPGQNPACATTHGLSLFAIGASAQTQSVPVPALPPVFAVISALSLAALAWHRAKRG
jgi:streptogramin lyase